MSKMLQENARGSSETSTPVRSVGLILDRDFAGKAAEFVKDAKSEIRIFAYAWRWYENEPELDIQKFNIEVLKATRRGVKVRAIVDTFAIFKELSAQGIDCRFLEPVRTVHTKAIMIDDKTLVLGSHNLTKRATSGNLEMSVAIQDYATTDQFILYFDTMWDVSNAS